MDSKVKQLCLAAGLLAAAFIGSAASTWAQEATPAGPGRIWFNRMCTQYGKVEDGFSDYLETVQPEIAVCGSFGPEYGAGVAYAKRKELPAFWTSLGGGPVDREWWRKFIARAHRNKIKVVGLFSLSKIFGDAEKGQGWFDYYDNLWPADVLGPKPVDAKGRVVPAVDLLQRTAAGLDLERMYRIEGGSEYRGCPSNPHWRKVLKGFVKAGIDLGLDGFHIIFPQRENCTCPHCQRRFKQYLAANFTPAQLAKVFGIANLNEHRFDAIHGFYDPGEENRVRHEMLKFTQMMIWECQQEVFMQYGRSLKPDLLLGQWNHIYRSRMRGPGQLAGTFAMLRGDERCVLPTDLWAKGEQWVWYSIGNWRLYWKPQDKGYSQFSLVHKYLREAGRGRPQAVKRDDNVNVAVYIAEAVAHGGFAYARGPKYTDPRTVEIVKTYFDFLRRHEDLYRSVETAAKVALMFPRSAVHRGDITALPDFKHLGHALMRRHVNFDVLIDQLTDDARRARYQHVLTPHSGELTDLTAGPIAKLLADAAMAEAPEQITTTVWRQTKPNRLIVHLVDHIIAGPPPRKKKPEYRAAPGRIVVRLPLGEGAKVRRVRELSPDPAIDREIAFDLRDNRLSVQLEPKGVYTVLVVELRD